MLIWSACSLSVEDDLWDLAVLHAGPVVVPGGVAELEGHLTPVVTVQAHLDIYRVTT